jgi:hypothetical protein
MATKPTVVDARGSLQAHLRMGYNPALPLQSTRDAIDDFASAVRREAVAGAISVLENGRQAMNSSRVCDAALDLLKQERDR